MGSSGDDVPLTSWCRMIFVQQNLRRYAPLSRCPNTHLSCLEGLNFPKYRFTIQFFGLFGWLCFAHL